MGAQTGIVRAASCEEAFYVGSPKIVLTASSTEASEFKHSVWQQMLSATIPFKFSGTFINPDSMVNESWPDGRAKYVPNGLRMVETLLLRDYDDLAALGVELGFSSHSHFSAAFQKMYGRTPSEFRQIALHR